MFPRLIKDDKEPEPPDESGLFGGAQPRPSNRSEAVVARSAEGQAVLESLFRATLSAADIPYYIAGSDGRLRYANPAFQALLGNGGAIEPGQPVTQLPLLADVFGRLAGSELDVRQSQSFMVHGQLRHFIGQHCRVVDGSGNFLATTGFFLDLSEQRRAEQRAVRLEERFDDLARSVSDWVWETDANMNLTYASLSIAKVLGVPPQILRGKYLFSFGCFEESGDEPQSVASLVDARIPFRNRRFLVKAANGSAQCHVQLSGVPVFNDANGRFSGYRGTGADITSAVMAERDRAEGRRALERAHDELRKKSEHLERALDEARAAAEAKSQFLARMSHELRTPLNAIIGFSEAASLRIFGVVNDRYADYFNNILRAGRHLLTLIEDILDATRIESGKLRVEPRAVRLREIVEGARGFVGLRATDKQVRLEVGTIPDSWYVWADPVRMQQILVNLLDNAVKFTGSGGHVGVECARHGAGTVEIIVWDSGIGIPADQLDLVFEHFHQVQEDSLQAGKGGLGLGLAISRQLAHMMGGDILVESQVGRGSRFVLRLPVADQVI